MLWETLILWLSNAAIALPQFFVNNEKGTSRRLPPILINFDYNSSEFVQWVTALLMINCTGSTGYALIKNNRSSLKPICDCRVYCCRWADNLLWHLPLCERETGRAVTVVKCSWDHQHHNSTKSIQLRYTLSQAAKTVQKLNNRTYLSTKNIGLLMNVCRTVPFRRWGGIHRELKLITQPFLAV